MNNEVIVELLGEGGSRALYGVRVGGRWLFAMDLITQVDRPTTSSGATSIRHSATLPVSEVNSRR
jgi:hypothetical protein